MGVCLLEQTSSRIPSSPLLVMISLESLAIRVREEMKIQGVKMDLSQYKIIIFSDFTGKLDLISSH